MGNRDIPNIRLGGREYRLRYTAFLPAFVKKPDKKYRGYILAQDTRSKEYLYSINQSIVSEFEDEMDIITSDIKRKDIPFDYNGRDFEMPWMKKEFIQLLEDSRVVVQESMDYGYNGGETRVL